ncbi:MAG: hypothetical protein Q4G39_04345 [Brachymonas sp.]|nr:hypothetical protein [Brachymonas sp.]
MKRVQTPASLNWLIKRRAKIAGERDRAAAELEVLRREGALKNARLQKEINRLKQRAKGIQALVAFHEESLRSIDHVIGHHEVNIDPALIRSIKEHVASH